MTDTTAPAKTAAPIPLRRAYASSTGRLRILFELDPLPGDEDAAVNTTVSLAGGPLTVMVPWSGLGVKSVSNPIEYR
jgi:hypothetical protein